MSSRRGDDHAAVAVPDQDARTRLVEDAPRCSHVCIEGSLGLLDHSNRIAVSLKDIGDGLPSGTVGEGAVDKHDRFDIRVCRECRHKRGAHAIGSGRREGASCAETASPANANSGLAARNLRKLRRLARGSIAGMKSSPEDAWRGDSTRASVPAHDRRPMAAGAAGEAGAAAG